MHACCLAPLQAVNILGHKGVLAFTLPVAPLHQWQLGDVVDADKHLQRKKRIPVPVLVKKLRRILPADGQYC